MKVEENKKRNAKYLEEFESWLNEQNLVKKTIRKHLNNVDLYINDFLNYYDVKKMEDGIYLIYDFLDGWFIEKCLWSSKNSIKENAASIKKFYECMSNLGYVDVEDYKQLCREIKNGMDDFLESMEQFDNGTYYDMFD